MTARGKEAAALALHRFGFGPVGDSISAIAGDPRGALLSDLDRPGAGYLAPKLPSSAAAARWVAGFFRTPIGWREVDSVELFPTCGRSP